MSRRLLTIAGLLLLLVGSASAQSPSPEALAAARKLVVTLKIADQYRTTLPQLMLKLRPVVARRGVRGVEVIQARLPRRVAHQDHVEDPEDRQRDGRGEEHGRELVVAQRLHAHDPERHVEGEVDPQ